MNHVIFKPLEIQHDRQINRSIPLKIVPVTLADCPDENAQFAEGKTTQAAETLNSLKVPGLLQVFVPAVEQLHEWTLRGPN